MRRRKELPERSRLQLYAIGIYYPSARYLEQPRTQWGPSLRPDTGYRKDEFVPVAKPATYPYCLQKVDYGQLRITNMCLWIHTEARAQRNVHAGETQSRSTLKPPKGFSP